MPNYVDLQIFQWLHAFLYFLFKLGSPHGAVVADLEDLQLTIE